MRAGFLLIILFLVLSLFSGVVLFNFSLVGFLILFVVGLVFAWAYYDKAILFFLGAREVRSGDQPIFFEAASQEAYKLAVSVPKIYVYDGSLDRGFILQNGKNVNLILSRNFLQKAQASELSSICFILLLQVKKGMASKRTKAMFLLGGTAWVVHGFSDMLASLIPIKDVKRSIEWISSYLLHSFLEFVFSIIMGESYFKKLEQYISFYPAEQTNLRSVGLKLQKYPEIYSLTSKKILEFSAASKGTSFRNVFALEILPHEWDILFLEQEMFHAPKN